jgi:hypothetical protein
MPDITPDLPLGLTEPQRAAVDRLELTAGVDLSLHHGDSDGWVASLITPDGETHSATGAGIGPFVLDAAEKWANPVI